MQSDLEIKTIYAIVRAGANEDASDRLVKELKPYLDGRDDKGAWRSIGIIRAVAGDCSLLGLGLSKEDSKLLSREADILIHSAANTAFNRPLSILSVNVSKKSTCVILN